MWILDLVDCLSCDSTDLGSGKLFCCGILWILEPVSGLCYEILGILDPVEPFRRRILWILDPVFWSRHVSDAHAVGTKRPEIQNSLFVSHTLHLAAPTVLGKYIESSEPCGVQMLISYLLTKISSKLRCFLLLKVT